GFDGGIEKERTIDGRSVPKINSNLTAASDITQAIRLEKNAELAFIGNCKGGPFDIDNEEAMPLLRASGNPHKRPNSDVFRPVINSAEVYCRGTDRWIIDNADL